MQQKVYRFVYCYLWIANLKILFCQIAHYNIYAHARYIASQKQSTTKTPDEIAQE